VRDIFSSLFHIESQHEVFDKYSTDKYLTDYGMVTDKRFRQRGIGTEFLKARAAILKSLNLQVTSSAFTVIGSQKAAVKANYVECYSIKWTEVGEKFPAFDFSIATVDCCKIMDMTV
jgi:GNAT superfamily N-acetyltransferase